MGPCQSCITNENLNLEMEIEKTRHNQMRPSLQLKEANIFGTERRVAKDDEGKKYSLDLFNLLNTIRNNPLEFVKILKKFRNEHIKNNTLTYLGKTIKLETHLNTLEENIDNLEHIDTLNKILKSIKLRINLPEGSMKGNLFDYLLKECNQIKEKYEFEYFDYVYIEGYGTPEEVACIGFCDDKLNESKLAKLILNPNFNQGEIFVLNKNILFIILAGETEDF